MTAYFSAGAPFSTNGRTAGQRNASSASSFAVSPVFATFSYSFNDWWCTRRDDWPCQVY